MSWPVPNEDRLSERLSVVTAGTAWSGNTLMIQGFLRGFRIRPATLSTVYDVRMEDRDGYDVLWMKGLEGEQVIDLDGIAVRSILTVYIENATANEAFDFKVITLP